MRVAPGKHSFGLRFNSDYELQRGAIAWQTATLTTEVDAMTARHGYHARHEFTPERVVLRVQDLGERLNHGLWLGLEGANRKFYPVTF